jgi:hypothetical protein
VEAAVERYLASTPRAPETMFDHLYVTLPRAYAGQRQELAASLEQGRGGIESAASDA